MHGTGLGLHCFAMRASVQRNALGPGLRGASAPLLHCEAMQPPVRPMGCKVRSAKRAWGCIARQCTLHCKAMHGPCPFDGTPNPSLHPVGLTGVRRSAGRMHGTPNSCEACEASPCEACEACPLVGRGWPSNPCAALPARPCEACEAYEACAGKPVS